MERVLVVFQATQAKTESLALAFGLGAVEGGANIRLRHLDSTASTELEHQGYTTPKPADLEWAEAVGLALESPEPQPVLLDFLNLLDSSKTADKKLFYVFGAEAQMPVVKHAQKSLERLGAALVGAESATATTETAQAIGKQIAAQA